MDKNARKLIFPQTARPMFPWMLPITWPQVTGVPINGYLISLGTTPGGVDLVDREATGINTFYKAPVGLPENTVIYATISVLLFNATPMDCESSVFTTVDVTTPPTLYFSGSSRRQCGKRNRCDRHYLAICSNSD